MKCSLMNIVRAWSAILMRINVVKIILYVASVIHSELAMIYLFRIIEYCKDSKTMLKWKDAILI